jgi:hypothetical protein
LLAARTDHRTGAFMSGKGRPGPDPKWTNKVHVKFDDELLDFVDGLANVMGVARAAVIRALCEAHRGYLLRSAVEYIETRINEAEKELQAWPRS